MTNPKLKKCFSSRRVQIFLYLLSTTYLVFIYFCNKYYYLPARETFLPKHEESPEVATAGHFFIIPNIIHFIHFGNSDLKFFEVISIRAAYLNQKPDKIMIHCDCHSLTGKYWDMVKDISVVEVKFMEKPTHVFGYRLSGEIHSLNIAKIQILMQYGGIYLDSGSYVVKSLNKYREFESSLGWSPGMCLGTHLLTACQNALFLKLWLNSYHGFEQAQCYYNITALPPNSVLQSQPDLVPRFIYNFDVQSLTNMLYESRTEKWKNHDVIPLLINHNTYINDKKEELNEENIKKYNRTFGDMIRIVLYGTDHFIE